MAPALCNSLRWLGLAAVTLTISRLDWAEWSSSNVTHVSRHIVIPKKTQPAANKSCPDYKYNPMCIARRTDIYILSHELLVCQICRLRPIAVGKLCISSQDLNTRVVSFFVKLIQPTLLIHFPVFSPPKYFIGKLQNTVLTNLVIPEETDLRNFKARKIGVTVHPLCCLCFRTIFSLFSRDPLSLHYFVFP